MTARREIPNLNPGLAKLATKNFYGSVWGDGDDLWIRIPGMGLESDLDEFFGKGLCDKCGQVLK